MSDPDKKDDQKFNETLKRMLETPPKPHDEKKEGEGRNPRPPVSDEDFQNGSDTK